MADNELRRAAALMRERANAATPGPWREATVDGNRYAALVSDTPPARQGGGEGWELIEGYGGYLIGESLTRHDRAHIAGLHPQVALVIADWLDAEADLCDDFDASPFVPALVVARAYLEAAGR